jgi:hypothetical protein
MAITLRMALGSLKMERKRKAMANRDDTVPEKGNGQYVITMKLFKVKENFYRPHNSPEFHLFRQQCSIAEYT